MWVIETGGSYCKTSCLPAHILNPVPGSVVLDMCAAPGMKTTQLAAMLSNDGTIYAVERDARRYKTLEKIVGTSGATCVRTINNDILACTNTEFPEVKYILVDPSCSGSGMTDRLEFHEEQSKARLEKLAGFQIKILRTALTRYPNVERVVYSTCSTYPEENEDVVRQVLETNYVFKLMDAKKLVDENWLSYGSSDYGDIGKFCLYAKPDKDFTNGFFVAVFERVKEGERNEFFNSKLFNYKKHIEQKRINRENRKIITIEKEKDDIEEINDVISLERHKWKHTEECKESEGLAMQQNDKLDQNNSDATYELHTEKEKSGTHLDESEANSDKKKKDKKSYSIKNADLAVTRDEECNLHLKEEADEDCIMSDSKLKFSVGKIKKTKLLKSIGYKKQASNNCELGLDVCTACDFKLNCLVEKMEKTKVKYTTDANTQVCNRDEDCTKSDFKLNCSEDTIKKSKLQRSVACDKQVSNSKLGHEICTTSDFNFNGSVEKKKKIQKMIEVNDSIINCSVEEIKTGKNKKMTDVNQVNNNEVSDKDCVTFNSKLNDSVEKRKNRKIRKTIDVNEIDNSEVHDKDCTESNTKGNCPVKQIKKKKNGKTIDVNHVHHSEIGDEDCAKINSKLNDSKMWKAIEDNKEDKQVSHKKDQLKLAVIKNEAEKKESDLELIFKINKKKHRKNSHDNSDAFIIPVIGAKSMCKLERKKRKKSNSADVDIQLETSDEYYKKKNRKETLDNLDVFSSIGAESTDETERKKRKKPKKNRRTSLNSFDAFSPIRSESISEVKRNKKKKPTSVDNDIQWMTNDEGLKINSMLNKDNTKSKREVSKHVKDFGLIDITGNLVTE
ncbi:probable E3 ubiquitin-protein ligase bre1 isoform X2 [Cylas formicarius]|uniref:probable E3 ubiquitin-protein ligase bre1 isoform X2 n=1 Tax=Cylas formicarius TaxID=197179 RepID=UPI0029589429|nr:probable E3 ubiquitin-protein ligase bre1 isoform X2 [Cylas formicarius]